MANGVPPVALVSGSPPWSACMQCMVHAVVLLSMQGVCSGGSSSALLLAGGLWMHIPKSAATMRHAWTGHIC
jgi:hypothetical protein